MPVEGAASVPVMMPMLLSSVAPFAVAPVPPFATGSAPVVSPRPSASRAPAAVVAPVPPCSMGSAPLVTSAAECLCPMAEKAALSFHHMYVRPVPVSTLLFVTVPLDATVSTSSVVNGSMAASVVPTRSHEPSIHIHS